MVRKNSSPRGVLYTGASRQCNDRATSERVGASGMHASKRELRDKGKSLPEAAPFLSFLPLIITTRARTAGARGAFSNALQNEPRRSTTNRLILMKPPRQ